MVGGFRGQFGHVWNVEDIVARCFGQADRNVVESVADQARSLRCRGERPVVDRRQRDAVKRSPSIRAWRRPFSVKLLSSGEASPCRAR